MIKIALPNGRSIEFKKIAISEYGRLSGEELFALYRKERAIGAATLGIGGGMLGGLSGGPPAIKATKAVIGGLAGAVAGGALKNIITLLRIGPAARKKLHIEAAKVEAKKAMERHS